MMQTVPLSVIGEAITVFLIDWILDTFSQGYTNLQSLVKGWIIEVLYQIHYAVKQGCVRLCNAYRCMSEAIFTVVDSPDGQSLVKLYRR